MKNLGIFGIALITILVAVQDASAKEVSEWTLDYGSDTTVPVNTAGELRNTQTGLCLRRETGLATRVQTDWRFTGCGNKRSKLLRKDPSRSGPLLCGEVFALQLNWDGRGECFRTCLGKPQPAGINICSETCGKDMHYQWQFKGCEAGKPVSPNTPLVLWNTAQQDSLVHGRRPPKIIPTCWAEKVLNGTCLSVRDQ